MPNFKCDVKLISETITNKNKEEDSTIQINLLREITTEEKYARFVGTMKEPSFTSGLGEHNAHQAYFWSVNYDCITLKISREA